MCCLGITSRCVGACGLISGKPMHHSSSYTRLAGIVPSTILQNKQSVGIVFHLVKYLGCSPGAHGLYAAAKAARLDTDGCPKVQNSTKGLGLGSVRDISPSSWKDCCAVACGSATIPCIAS